MIEKKIRYLKLGYIFCIMTVILAFILIFIYIEKNNPALSYIGLERSAILITLCGIFASLKYLNPKVATSTQFKFYDTWKLYARKYYLRLTCLVGIYSFNLVDYIITGSKNFIFLAFICIFALFLCSPNKTQIEIRVDNDLDDEIK